MRRAILYIGISFLTFVFGVQVNSLALKYVRVNFVAVSSLHDPEYHIYWYRTPNSHDLQEITLYADFRSREVTREHFESNATPDGATVIEIGSKVDENGHVIGRRGVTMFKGLKAVRIFWTDGDSFWFVQAPSLKLAHQFEESAQVQSIRLSHKARLK